MTSYTQQKEGAKFRDLFHSASIALFLASKFGKLIKSSKASAVAAKFAEFGVTLGTAALSTVVYAFTFGGWWFAVGLVGMLFVHEMGHVLAMHREGLKTRAPVFIPLLGAFVFAPEPRGRAQEARIGYAGPLVGTLGVLAVFLLALATSGGLRTNLLIVGLVGAAINLVNLIIPIRPLDGGRVTQIIGGWFKYLGLGVLTALILLMQSRGLLLILIFVLFDFKLPPKLKAAAAVMSTLTMFTMVLFQLGGPQPFLLDCVNLLVAAAITFLFVREAVKGSEQVAETRHDEPVSWPVRFKWLGLYFGLIAVLLALMALHAVILFPGVTGG